MKGGVLVRDVSTEGRARFVAVAGVDRSGSLADATGFESLPVGGTGRPIKFQEIEITAQAGLPDSTVTPRHK